MVDPSLAMGVVLRVIAAACLVAAAAVDLQTRRLPNALVGGSALAALAAAIASGMPPWWSSLAGGVAGLAVFAGIFWLGRGALGVGDVKLAGAIGLLTGLEALVPALALGVLAGGVGAAAMVLLRRGTLRSRFAYGPYLVGGALVAVWLPPTAGS